MRSHRTLVAAWAHALWIIFGAGCANRYAENHSRATIPNWSSQKSLPINQLNPQLLFIALKLQVCKRELWIRILPLGRSSFSRCAMGKIVSAKAMRPKITPGAALAGWLHKREGRIEISWLHVWLQNLNYWEKSWWTIQLLTIGWNQHCSKS